MEKSIRFPTMQYPFFCLLSLVKCISVPLNSKLPLRYHFTSKLPLRYHITIYVANDNAMFCLTFDHKIRSNTRNVWRKAGTRESCTIISPTKCCKTTTTINRPQITVIKRITLINVHGFLCIFNLSSTVYIHIYLPKLIYTP